MTSISEAVILMAGEGSRLRGADKTFLKPFVPVLGRPLISYTLDALFHAGIKTVHFVVGYESERMIAQVKQLIPSGVNASFIENRNWRKQNGISLLAAAGHAGAPFLLTMSDHLFDDAMVGRLLDNFDPGLLNIAVDRKLDSIFDLHDAMKVQTRRNRIIGIGKDLREFDAIDTGLFVCPLEIFDYLERAKSDSCQNDCSLADGLRLMAGDDKVWAIDIDESWWQDVDTPEMLQHAERQMAKSPKAPAAQRDDIRMPHECVILADSPGALVELCGISTLERLLRTLQRCGIERATILSSTPDPIAKELARPSRARAQLNVTLRTRPAGWETLEQVVDIWPDIAQFLLLVRGDTVFDSRLLHLMATQNAPAALVDSAVPSKFQPLVASAPNMLGVKLCGAALLQRNWFSTQSGPLDEAINTGLEQNLIAAVDVASQRSYSPALRRKLRPFWFPAPLPEHVKLAERILLNSVQKGTQDFPARVHAPFETFLISKLCKTAITPNQLTVSWIILAFVVAILFATGDLILGIVFALIIGILDGLDGKQARIRVETSKAGKIEHWFDSFFEVVWPTALAYHFYVSGQLPNAFFYLALLIVAEALDGVGKLGVYGPAEKSLVEPGLLDRIVRLVGGRRNIYVWVLVACVVLGMPEKALIVMAFWEVATAAVDLLHYCWIFLRNRHLFSIRLRD